MIICRMCEKRGKDWEGDDPRCAFRRGYVDAAPVFDHNNWNCATINRLRSLVSMLGEDGAKVSDVNVQYIDGDYRYATVNLQNTESDSLCLWMTWYKNRGRTDKMWLLSDTGFPRVPTEDECWDIVCSLEGYV
jgi:hypothetical protein